MVRILTVHTRHVVNVIVLHRVDELVHERLVELESSVEFGRVLIGHSLRIRVPIN